MAVEPKATMAATTEKRILSLLAKRTMDETEPISAERSLLNQIGCPTILKAYCKPADPIVTEMQRRMAGCSVNFYWFQPLPPTRSASHVWGLQIHNRYARLSRGQPTCLNVLCRHVLIVGCFPRL
jgi:hypothetical protein